MTVSLMKLRCWAEIRLFNEDSPEYKRAIKDLVSFIDREIDLVDEELTKQYGGKNV